MAVAMITFPSMIRRAPKKFVLTEATRRRWVNGTVVVEVTESRAQPTLSLDEEAYLQVNHIL